MNINITMSDIYMITGFLLSVYSCVSNDVIQTLGTFLSSTKDRPVWQVWLFASTVLVLTLFLGWYFSGGDIAFGRLDRIPAPEELQFWHVLPPIILILLTKKGFPVATAFLILSIFSSSAVIGLMVMKSVVGYISAFVGAFIVYFFLARKVEKYFLYSKGEISPFWVVAKWVSTAFLWSTWLMQDAAVLYVYLPRSLDLWQVVASLLVFVGLLYIICYRRGGEIQDIVKLKTNTQDMRSATIIDLVFALLLFIFQHINNIPMSTTWVFIGVLAGREIALYNRIRYKTQKKVYKHVLKDLTKAFIGLVVSISTVVVLTNLNLVKESIKTFFGF